MSLSAAAAAELYRSAARLTVDADPKEIASDVPQFVAQLERIPWFLNLGKPHRWDKDVARIHSWDEWPGPEAGHGDWFGRWPAVVREAIEAEQPGRRDELQAV
jgi:hypothetical protein